MYGLGDPLCFTIPTRHSKSLDHLQFSSTNKFHYSLSNIRGYNETTNVAPSNQRDFSKRQQKLKNVASEHNMRNNIDYFKYTFEDPDDNLCSCSYNNYNTLRPKHKSKIRKDELASVDVIVNSNQGIVEKKYKQFSIKNLSNVRKQYQTIVKSQSQTNSENNQNIFKSNSMQFFPPRKKNAANGSKPRKIEKTRKLEKGLLQNGAGTDQVGDMVEHKRNRRSKSKSSFINSRCFDIVSTSSSTESLVNEKFKTGSKCKALFSSNGIKRARSTSCITEDQTPLVLSGTESLPDITPKAEERLFPEMKFYSSSSSTTSEQSGWITSRSSSIGNNLI